MTGPYPAEGDPLQVFLAALTPAARAAFHTTQQTPGHVHAAIGSGRYTPVTLAAYVGRDVGHYVPANGNDLMQWRLRRAASHTTNDND